MEVSGLSNTSSSWAAGAAVATEVQLAAKVAAQKDGSAPAQASEKPASKANASLDDIELKFNVKVVMGTDPTTGRQVVRIMSQDGKRLLRQMPPDQALELAARAREGSVRHLLTSLV